jgi:hypothetical protein
VDCPIERDWYACFCRFAAAQGASWRRNADRLRAAVHRAVICRALAGPFERPPIVRPSCRQPFTADKTAQVFNPLGVVCAESAGIQGRTDIARRSKTRRATLVARSAGAAVTQRSQFP